MHRLVLTTTKNKFIIYMNKSFKTIYTMKTLFFLLVFCSGLLMLIGCEQSILEEPKPVPLKPAIEVTVLPSDTISFNTSATIRYKNSNTTRCTVNGKDIDPSGGEFNTGVLTSTTTYTFISTGEGGSVKKEITVVVGLAPAPSLVVTKTDFKDNLKFGDKTNFSWKAEGEITSVTLNGSPVEKEGSKSTGPLFENTEYVLKVVGPGGEKVEKLPITVGDWTTSTLGILQHYKRWIVKKNNRLNSNKEFMYDVVFNIKQETAFTKECKYVTYWDDKNVSSGDFCLRDNDTTLWLQDAPVAITKIDKDTLIYIQKSSNDDTYLEYIYIPEP
jgi:hypothetical protein